MDRPSRKKISKETVALNDTVVHLDLLDIHRTFHPKTAEYTFFSSAHGMFSRIDHMLGYKTILGKFKRTEIISSIFSNYSGMKLQINYRRKSGKNKHVKSKLHATKKTIGL